MSYGLNKQVASLKDLKIKYVALTGQEVPGAPAPAVAAPKASFISGTETIYRKKNRRYVWNPT